MLLCVDICIHPCRRSFILLERVMASLGIFISAFQLSMVLDCERMAVFVCMCVCLVMGEGGVCGESVYRL